MKKKALVILLLFSLIMPSLIFAHNTEDKDPNIENTTYNELVKVIGTGEEMNYGYWYVNESLNTSGRDKGVLSKGFEIRDICDNFMNQAGQGKGGFVLVPSKTVDVGALAPHHLI